MSSDEDIAVKKNSGFAGLLSSNSGSDSEDEVKPQKKAQVFSRNKKPEPKPQGKKKANAKSSKNKNNDEDDWAILNQASAEVSQMMGTEASQTVKVDSNNAVNKNKKPAPAKEAPEKDERTESTATAGESVPKQKQSARGRMIAERLAKQREEEERKKKIQEELERKEREEEERIAAEKKRIEEKKAEEKRKAEELKAKLKAEGKYKTKKQIEKEKKAKAALAAMEAAGYKLPTSSEKCVSKGIVYSDRRKKPSTQNSAPKVNDTEPEEVKEIQTAVEEVKLTESVEHVEDHNASDDLSAVDDWATADIDDIVGALKISNSDAKDVEDLAEKEMEEEQERLRQLGLKQIQVENERRAEEERKKAEEEEIKKQELVAQERKHAARKTRLDKESNAQKNKSESSLRSPIVCIMGHVDTGKTKLLDKIRQTNVQEGEAGGITQQIGATFFPQSVLKDKINTIASKWGLGIRIPGMLVIDTPGHESFSNLRSRGSSLCDIAILVIDIMHGLEPQTIESLNMLRSKKAPFVVALNKIDRCYGWKSIPNGVVRKSLASQDRSTKDEFETRTSRVRLALNEKGLNAELYWENNDLSSTISLIPTSAITGEGIPDLLFWLTKLTQEKLTEKIMFMPEFLQCTVLEVKAVEGLGTTIDTIIVNGKLKENDKIVVCTLEGPVVTHIRALLTPPPSRELRIKAEYIHHKEIYGAMGVKISAQNIEKAVAGTPIMVVENDDDIEDLKEEVMRDFTSIMKMDLELRGVLVQASTLGALEALMQFLRHECDPPIPVSAVNIGPVYRRDVMRASIMIEKGKPEYATILAFDVKIDPDARSYADTSGVRIFTADIIYHLFDQFTSYINGIMEQRRTEAQGVAVFPCICRIFPQHIFNKKDPIIVGMEVVEGTLRVGTPLCIPSLSHLYIGKVTSIEDNHRPVDKLAKGRSGAVRIEDPAAGTVMYGRQFDATSGSLYSMISRASIDSLKENFRSEVTKDDMKLLVQMKKVFGIP